MAKCSAISLSSKGNCVSVQILFLNIVYQQVFGDIDHERRL